jgi:nitroreductase
MEFMDVILSRHSVRNFTNEPIPAEILQQILEAGRWAPSAQNKQPWRFLILTDRARIAKLPMQCGFVGITNQFMKDAAFIVIACANPKQDLVFNQQAYYLVDTANALQQMVLAAWSFGIGSCWLAGYSEAAVKKHLQIPEPYKVVAICPFGYPKEKTFYTKAVSAFAKSDKRLPLDKTVTFNEWSL